MPTVFRSGPYRFFFFSADRGEAAHLHVTRDDYVAKFWLDPVELGTSYGFSRRELARIQGLVEANVTLVLKAWNDFFSH